MNEQGIRDYRDTSPMVITASLSLLIHGIIQPDDLPSLSNQQRCERLESAGFTWTGRAWEKSAKP